MTQSVSETDLKYQPSKNPIGRRDFRAQGLLLFRRGYQKEGRALYRRAIEEARKLGLKSSSAIASIYLAREEILSESDEVEKAIESASEESRNIADPAIRTILDKVLEMKKQDGLKLIPGSPQKQITN